MSAISRSDTDYKNVLESERVCSKHFIFGEPSAVWDQFHVDWVPTLNLGKKKYVEKDFKQGTGKEKTTTSDWASWWELEAAEKRKCLNTSGLRIGEIKL